MEHGRHVERERAWLLNFYILVLAAVIYGLSESHGIELPIAFIILSMFSIVALIATIKLDAEYAHILRLIEDLIPDAPLPVSRTWYRPFLSVGSWTSFFYGFMFALFISFVFKGLHIPTTPLHVAWLTFSGMGAFCLRHAVTEHTRQKSSWCIWLVLSVIFILISFALGVFLL